MEICPKLHEESRTGKCTLRMTSTIKKDQKETWQNINRIIGALITLSSIFLSKQVPLILLIYACT